jgi:hypothetical protein
MHHPSKEHRRDAIASRRTFSTIREDQARR